MLSRKQIDSKSNVPIELTSDDLAKAERDARSKYGGRDGKQMTQSQRNKVLTKIKNTPKAKTMTYLSPAGSGKPVPLKTRRIIKKKPFKSKMDLSKPIKDPWFTGKDDYPDAFTGNKPETKSQKIPDNQPKSNKIGGKSFDDLIKDAKKKNKVISQDIAKLKTKSFVPPKTTPLVTPPKLDPITQPLTEPLKKTRTLKKIKIKAPPKTGTFKKIMKFAGKNKSPIAKTIGYTAAAAYLLSRFGNKTDNAPKNNKALVGGPGNYITKVTPKTTTFALAGKGGDGYRPAGMKK